MISVLNSVCYLKHLEMGKIKPSLMHFKLIVFCPAHTGLTNCAYFFLWQADLQVTLKGEELSLDWLWLLHKNCLIVSVSW